MRVLVCGDREWKSYARICAVIKMLNSAKRITHIIEGGARGADRKAAICAEDVFHFSEEKGTLLEFKANWVEHGRVAGPIRNEKMLDYGKPDLVVAFHDHIEDSMGTKDMLLRALQAGVECRLFTMKSEVNVSETLFRKEKSLAKAEEKRKS